MAWVTKGSRAYEIRSIRRGHNVTSTYIGGGIPAEAAEFFRWLDASRRAEREAERAEWEAERDQFREVERQTIEADDEYEAVAEAALLAAGYHRPSRGRWRKRRSMATQIDVTEPDQPLVTGQEMNDLLDRIDAAEGDEKKKLQNHVHQGIQLLLKHAKAGVEAAVPALRVVLARRPNQFGKMEIARFAAKALASSAAHGDAFLTDVLVGEIKRTAADVAGPNPTPLERLLAERVSLAWFDANQSDCKFFEVTGGDGCSFEKADYYSKQRSRATGRFLAAARSLATVRRLALPTLQIHIGAPMGAALEPTAGPEEAPAPRLRLSGQP
jgi:hypothetical protein